MTSMADRIVIIGAGQAGLSAAEALRARGHEGSIILLGDEAAPPYQRPPLSKKYLLGEMDAERLWLKPESFYADNAIDLRADEAAVAINRGARHVETASGDAIAYDALIIATGATPRRLPASMGGDLPGVHVLRSLADVDALAPTIAEGRRLVVVGGGYIGLEAAAVARQQGMTVTVLEAAPRILSRVAGAPTADFLRSLHARHGVDIVEGARLESIEGDGAVSAVRLQGGRRLKADVVLLGIGVTPNTALAEAAGIECDNGIVVDATGRASDPAIYAVGDVARFPWQGRPIRLESVQNAIDQPKVAAAAIMGEDVVYDPVPWFWSDQYDLKLQIAGLCDGHDRVVTRPGTRDGTTSTWYFRKGALIAGDGIGDARAYMTGKRWLEAGVSPDADALSDPASDLKTLA
jgi:3-phenylpropionate/trans-cinnamate dioxygenase ferredoxin reductase subunit